MANYIQTFTSWFGHSINDTIPTAVGKLRHKRTDTNTGKEFLSDNTNWIELGMDAVVTKTAAYTATDEDHTILVDSTTAGFTLTLPTAIGRSKRRYRIKKIDTNANTVIIDPNGTETIDGLLTWELKIPEEFVEIISDGVNWKILDYTPFDINAYRRIGATTNRWYVLGQVANTALSSVAVTANIIYGHPLIVPKLTTLNDIGLNIVTGVAATNVKIAVYKDNGNLIPASLIYDAGELATATSTVFLSVAMTPALKLQPGLYWIGIVFNGAPTIKFVPLASQGVLLGIENTAAISSATPSFYKSFTYPVTVMPDPFPVSPIPNYAAQIPAIYARFV